MATTRRAAAFSPPTTSGEGAGREGGWARPGLGTRAAVPWTAPRPVRGGPGGADRNPARHPPAVDTDPRDPCPPFAPRPARGRPGTCEGGGGDWWGMGRPALFLKDQSSRPKCFSYSWTWITGSLPFFACGELTPKERGEGVRSSSLSLEACPGRPALE